MKTLYQILGLVIIITAPTLLNAAPNSSTVGGSNRNSYCDTALKQCVVEAQQDCGKDTDCQTSEVQTCKRLYGQDCKNRSGGNIPDKVKIDQKNGTTSVVGKVQKNSISQPGQVIQQCRQLKDSNWLCTKGREQYLCDAKKQNCRISHGDR